MITEELEFQISQYIDGQLSADDAARLESLASADPDVAGTLARYRQLDAQLRDVLAPPAYDENALTESITAALDDRQSQKRDVIFVMPAVWARRAGLAIAACLVAAVGTWLVLSQSNPAANKTTAEGTNRGTIHVTGPRVQVAEAPAVTEIRIGPARNAMAMFANEAAADVVVGRPSRVVIASSQAPSDDSRGWFGN